MSTTITITFTNKQFKALEFLLMEMNDSERQYVADNYEDYDDMAENQLTHLNEIGAGETNYADIQRVWNAINKKDEDDDCPGCLAADCEDCSKFAKKDAK